MESQIQVASRTRRFLRGLGWVALASALAVSMLATTSGATLVSATAVVTSLHQTPPIASTDPEFQGSGEECAGLNLGAGQVLWHFVLVQTAAPKDGSFIHATFNSGDSGDVPASKKSGSVLHFNIINTATSLTGAHTNAAGRQLNLSHICQGPPVTTTTSTTTTSTTTTVTTTTQTSTS